MGMTDKEKYDEYVAYCKRMGHVQLSFGRYCQIIPHIDELVAKAVYDEQSRCAGYAI